jgi:hypothetical protein
MKLYSQRMNSFTIGQVAERTGFSTSTLRQYEELGLVAPPRVLKSGCRLHDDRVLGRVAFVARAKPSIGMPVARWHHPRRRVRGRIDEDECQRVIVCAFCADGKHTPPHMMWRSRSRHRNISPDPSIGFGRKGASSRSCN